MDEPQSNSEVKDSLSVLKDDFPSRTDSSGFTSIVPASFEQSNERGSVFPVLKLTYYDPMFHFYTP